MNGLYRINSDYLTLKFKKKVNVEVYWLDNQMLQTVYTGESKAMGTKSYTLNKMDNVQTYTKNDTFYIDIPIISMKTALDINFSDDYMIKPRFSIRKKSLF